MRITLNDEVQQTEDIVSSKVDSDIVMMSITNDKYFGMNDIAGRIWEIIGDKIQVSGIVEILCSEFDVSPAQCEQDVLTFINKLSDLGILNHS